MRTAPPLSSLTHFKVNRGPVHGARMSGLGAIIPPVDSVASGSTITLTNDQMAAAIAQAAADYVVLPAAATTPNAADLAVAVNTLNGNIPQVAVAESLPVPSQIGSNYTALSGFYTTPKYRRYAATRAKTLSGMGSTINSGQASTIAAATTTVSLIALDASIGAMAGPIGAAVGVVVGVIMGLFAKKVQSPPTTAAQLQQAATYIATYKQMAGSVIGRAYPLSTIQDMAMAFCINADKYYNNAGGCGNQAGITNTWNEQLARLNLFFTTIANTAIGATVTLRDIPSLPGHGNTNMNVTFEFPNPGVQSPNYILGPLYAQYFYVMCNIFQDSANCAGLQLTAPVPQFYCDLIDWYRAQHAAWDIPAGTVDAPVEYTAVSLQPGQVTTSASTADVAVLTTPAVVAPASVATAALTASSGFSLTDLPGVASTEEGESLTIESNGTALATGGQLVAQTSGASNASILSTSSILPSSLTSTAVVSSVVNPDGSVTGITADGTQITANADGSVTAVDSAGNLLSSLSTTMTSTDWLILLGAGAVLVAYLASRGSK
jgi:hypothetical protein